MTIETPEERSPVVIFQECRERERSQASEVERKTGDIQATKYETALLRLLRRTNDNPKIANALNAFVDALEAKSTYGASDKPLTTACEQELGDFLTKAAEELAFDVQWGGQPAPNIKEEWRKSWREKYHLEKR